MTLDKFLDLSQPQTSLLIILESWGAFSGIPCVRCFLSSGHAVNAYYVVSAIAIPPRLPALLLCPVGGPPFRCGLFIFYAAGPTRIDWASLGVQLVPAGCHGGLGPGERIFCRLVKKPKSRGAPGTIVPDFRQQLCSQTTVCNFSLISFTMSPLLEVPGDSSIKDLFDKSFCKIPSHQIVLAL